MDFGPGFFDRSDPAPDAAFYAPPRLVTHIDAGAIAAVGALYAEPESALRTPPGGPGDPLWGVWATRA